MAGPVSLNTLRFTESPALEPSRQVDFVSFARSRTCFVRFVDSSSCVVVSSLSSW
jgi:hypothetical protein